MTVLSSNGKFVFLQPAQARRERVDGVVGHRQRAVTTRVGRHQLIVAVDLLRAIELIVQRLAVVADDRGAIVVEHEFGVDELAMVLQQPVDAVRAAALLVRGEREDDVAIGAEAFLLHADEGRHHDGVAVLHILRAAPVEVAVLFDELERIGRPVLAPRLHHVEVPDQQYRLVLTRTAKPHHHVFLAGVRPENGDVAVRKTGGPQPLCHRFRGRRDVTDGVGGVDLDELLENRARQRVR